MKRKNYKIRKYLREIKVGIFFVGALLLFFIAIMSIREVSVFRNTYQIKVVFDFAEGLKSASPVRFCGVDVGEIQGLEIRQDGRGPEVYVNAKILEGTKIPVNSRFFVNSLSLFGEKYLEIIPPESVSGEYIEKGAVVEGVDSAPLFDVLDATHQAMNKVNDLITDDQIKGSVSDTLDNFNSLAKELNGFIVDIRSEKGTIGKLFYDDSIYRNTNELLQDLKKNPWKLLYKPKQ
jgi:phospholipid/cholesterol/gamma-HCH transport system substrate-binding protein